MAVSTAGSISIRCVVELPSLSYLDHRSMRRLREALLDHGRDNAQRRFLVDRSLLGELLRVDRRRIVQDGRAPHGGGGSGVGLGELGKHAAEELPQLDRPNSLTPHSIWKDECRHIVAVVAS